MICGYQASADAFCARRKTHGLPCCAQHYESILAEYGEVRFAPGNALGEAHWATRLLWEPCEGSTPVEPSADEVARYAGILSLAGGE